MTIRILKIFSIILVLLIIGGLTIVLTMDFRWSDAKYLRKIEEAGQKGSVYYSPAGEDSIRVVQSGLPDKQAMVFLHGAPGSNRDYKEYLYDGELCSKFQLLAIDRPGYGYSTYGRSERSVIRQAAMIADGLPDSSIVVGHSYGGPVAASLAIFHPEKVRKLVLLAPAVDPENEKQFFVNRMMNTALLRRLISPALEVALDEKLSHEASLNELLPYWKDLEVPVILVHGRGDRIVPYENVEFLQNILGGSSLEIHSPEGMDHIMIWTDFEWVKELLLTLPGQISS